MKEYTFFENVYAVVKLIPEGRITSYGAIAVYLGAKRSARMVGWALNASLNDNLNIPAHRVTNRNGLLTVKKYFSTPKKMQELLEKEGINVQNVRVEKFKDLFWDPSIELL